MDVFWLEQRQADVPGTDEWLSARELERLHTFKIPKRRADWRLGRWTAKLAVADLLGLSTDLAEIEIVPEPSGAPRVLVRNDIAGVTISISHSAGVGACAVAEHGVIGCDIEIVEPRSAAFLEDYFTPFEKVLITSAGNDQEKMATIVWSAKESALKALGEGLRMDTRSVCVTQIDVVEPASWSAIRVSRETGETFEGWWCEADRMVRTIVAGPAPGIPINLEVTFEALV